MTKKQGIRTEPAVDTAATVEVLASAIAKKGYKAVGRYYSFSKWKQLQRSEAQQLISAGLSVITIYEDSNNQASKFTEAIGKQQAQEALRLAQTVISQPEGSGIYFAVDYDAPYYDYVNYIRPYMKAIISVFKAAGNPYKLGIYGNGLVCNNALKDKLVAFTWLSQSQDFNDYHKFRESRKWNLLQGAQVRISGTDFDSNTINMTNGDFGGFTHLVPREDQPC